MELKKIAPRQVRLPVFSVVIPTYGEKGISLTEQCLSSLYQHHNHLDNIEIFVVLDGDTDDKLIHSMKFLCQAMNVTLIAIPRGGFARACNVGISQSNGGMVFLVNNDIVFTEPTLQVLTEAQGDLRNTHGCGVIGTRLLYANEQIQHGGVYFVNQKHENGLGYFDHAARGAHKYHPMAYSMRPSLVTGALFGISREAISRVGLLDERYGFTCEDVDYCLKSIEAGLPSLYFGFTSAFHLEGGTRGNTPESKLALAPDIIEKEQASMRFLFKKWQGVQWQRMFGGG